MKIAHAVLVVAIVLVVIFVMSERVEMYAPTPSMHDLPLEAQDQIARIAHETAAARATSAVEPKRVRFTLPATSPSNKLRAASKSWIAQLATTTSEPAW